MTEFTTWRSLVDGAGISGAPDSVIERWPILDRSNATIENSLSDNDATANGTTNISNNYAEGFAEDADGSSGTYVDQGAEWTAELLGGRFGFAFTVENPASGDLAGQQNNTPSDSTPNMWVLTRSAGGSSEGTDGDLEIILADGSNNSIGVYSNTNIVDEGGKFRCFFLKDGESASDLSLYINNNEESNVGADGNYSNDNIDDNATWDKFVWGARWRDGSDDGNTASIWDDVRWYGPDVSTDDVEADYNFQPWS